jgi:hypothetical protein
MKIKKPKTIFWLVFTCILFIAFLFLLHITHTPRLQLLQAEDEAKLDSLWCAEREYIRVNKDTLKMLLEKYRLSNNVFEIKGLVAGCRSYKSDSSAQKTDTCYSICWDPIKNDIVRQTFFQSEDKYFMNKQDLSESCTSFRTSGDTVFCPAIFLVNLVQQVQNSNLN